MEKRNAKYAAYVQTLKEELVPAMGCTEPMPMLMELPGPERCWGKCRTGGCKGASRGKIIKCNL